MLVIYAADKARSMGSPSAGARQTGRESRKVPIANSEWTGMVARAKPGFRTGGPDGARTSVDHTWQNKNRIFPVQGPFVTIAAVRYRAAPTRS